jgi:5-oxoprolinase (ATP-hydrolysing)
MRVTGYPSRKWFFSVDRGGTFTDIIGVDPEGNVCATKLLSQSPDYPDPAVEGIRHILRLTPGKPIPEEKVAGIRMGTTVATNALLERKGEPTALFITKGFRDLLEIGYQNRPHLFKLAIEKTKQLYCYVREVDERIDHTGEVITPINLEAVAADLLQIQHKGITSIAVVLLHAWVNCEHEKSFGTLAREMGFQQISISHEIMPLIKVVGRGQTTVVDAYLSPILKKYIHSIRKSVGNIPLEFMQSSGGITEAGTFTGKDAILSGPAGGVIGSSAVATINGITESIGIDMGGTSTDVSRFGGSYDKVFEVKTAGVQFQAPSLNILTVAAGGGSILWFDGRKLRVGPESAGADPGPVCYGRNGTLALTDANLLLGRILPDFFPKTFGSARNQPLNTNIVTKKFRTLTDTINRKLNTCLTPVEVALGFVKIANETMCKPIKEISVARGFDIRNHALICFGGAAPQHACAIARILGIKTIIIHPLAGLLSAYGIAMANHLRYRTRSIVKTLSRSIYRSLDAQFESLIHHC